MPHFLDRPAGWAPEWLADVYDETSLWSARFGALLFDHLQIVRGVRALDVGCATGFPLFELAQLHGATSHFTGIDIWGEALERARLRLDRLGLTTVDFVEADVASMPFPSEYFDLIVSNLGLNNFSDMPGALRECRRVARTGARLVLTTNLQGHFDEAYRLLNVILEQNDGAGDARAALRANEEHRLTRAKIERLLADAGFSPARAFEQSFRMRFADGAAMLHHALVKWFLDGWRQAVGPERERQVFTALEAQLNTIADRDSGIEMTVPMLYIEGVAA
jgi:ubiquinone/menaquinone biosynthesis C-methylase UbiE